MSREAHVRFWESAGVKLPRATHLLLLRFDRMQSNRPLDCTQPAFSQGLIRRMGG